MVNRQVSYNLLSVVKLVVHVEFADTRDLAKGETSGRPRRAWRRRPDVGQRLVEPQVVFRHAARGEAALE